MSSSNTIKTVLLLAVLTAVLLVAGRVIAGPGGMAIALVFALIMNLGTYWFSDRIALSMARAKEASINEAPESHNLVERLAANAGLAKPRVYVIDNPSPNAFATGRDPRHSAVEVTRGMVGLLDRDELAGVIAHELARIRNRDTLIAAIAAAIAGAITCLAYMAQWSLIFGGFGSDEDDGGGIGSLVGSLLMIVLAPLAAIVIQMAISRGREYDADATGARLLGNPLPLASALAKLQAGV